MGRMIDGEWHGGEDSRNASDGRFVRATTSFRDTPSPPTAPPASGPSPAAITSMFRTPAPGPTGP